MRYDEVISRSSGSYCFQIHPKPRCQVRTEICSHCGKSKKSMNKASKVIGFRSGTKQPMKAGKVTRKAPPKTTVKPSAKIYARNQGDTQHGYEDRKLKSSTFLKPSLVRNNERITSATAYKWQHLSSPLSLKEMRFKSSKEKITAMNSRRLRATGKASSGHYRAVSASVESNDQYQSPFNDKVLREKFLKQRMKQHAARSSYMHTRAQAVAQYDPGQSKRYRGAAQDASERDPDHSRRHCLCYREELAHFQALIKHMVKECMQVCFKFGIQGSLPRHLDLHDNASYATIIENLLNECDALCAQQEQERCDYRKNDRTTSRFPLPEPIIFRQSGSAYHTTQRRHATGARRNKSWCTCNSNTSEFDCCCLEGANLSHDDSFFNGGL